jgi:hypothetical protein
MFSIRNGLKQGDALSPLLFNFDSEYAIKRVQVNQDGLKLNGTVEASVVGTTAPSTMGTKECLRKSLSSW